MADRELSEINQSGELQDILLKALGDGAKLLTKDEIYAILNGYLTTASLGNFTFENNAGLIDDYIFVEKDGETLIIGNDYISILLDNLAIGNIDSASGKSAITKEWALAKMPSLGNWEFGDGGTQNIDGYRVFTVDDIPVIGRIISIGTGGSGQSVTLNGITPTMIDDANGSSVVSKDWSLAKFFQQTQFINAFSGSANQPILTGLDGKIDSTLIPTQSSPQGNFTPTGGAEYPDITGDVAGDYWVVDNVGAGYTFVAGDLAGRIVYESAWMVLDVNLNWFLSNNYSGTVQTAWGSIIGTLADQIDLNNALGLKADQTDVVNNAEDIATNGDDITSNSAAILTKADQTALDTTNTNVSTNTGNITTLDGRVTTNETDIGINASAIADKADQTALDTTDGNVATNTADILTNTGNLTTLDGKVTQNETDISTAQQDILNNAFSITQNTDAITALENKKAAFQANSTATTIGVLVSDFNSLLDKLKVAGFMETS